jgi:glutathione S-transferase
VSATLYGMTVSHPSRTAQLILRHKRIAHRMVNLVPGIHPLMLRAVGFRGRTVPALMLDGDRRVQGSLEIATAVEQLRPEPPLYPADPEARAGILEAERWGHDTFQDIPRRTFRWAAKGQWEVRHWLAGAVVGMPAPGIAATLNGPVARVFAHISDASDENVQRDLGRLPQLLDHVDALIASGTIGGEVPNAADFQIAPALRVLLAYPQLRPTIESRPSGELARRLVPDYPEPIPAQLPPDWVPA